MAHETVVFLDRDGTINVDLGYVTRPDQVRLIDGAAGAIAQLKRAGCLVVIVTNQSAIARGIASAEEVEQTNTSVCEALELAHPEAIIDHVYYCPHAPEDDCACRKPKTGMIQGLQVDLSRAFVVGDKLSDLGFGENLGIPLSQRFLVRTGHGEEELQILLRSGAELPVCVVDLEEAVGEIMQLI